MCGVRSTDGYRRQRNGSRSLSGRPLKVHSRLKTRWPHQARVKSGCKGGRGRGNTQGDSEERRYESATNLEGGGENSEIPEKRRTHWGKGTLSLRNPTDMPKAGPEIQCPAAEEAKPYDKRANFKNLWAFSSGSHRLSHSHGRACQ